MKLEDIKVGRVTLLDGVKSYVSSVEKGSDDEIGVIVAQVDKEKNMANFMMTRPENLEEYTCPESGKPCDFANPEDSEVAPLDRVCSLCKLNKLRNST